MTAIPIEIPDDGNERVINVSGGRTSGYMLAAVLAAHNGKLPPLTRAIYTNTGMEREETLVFLRKMAQEWSVEITWLEYAHRPEAVGGIAAPKHIHKVVDFDTAARNGKPFEALIHSGGYLPNPTQRKCTTELKVRTIERYMRRALGIKKHRAVLGIRYDEPKRAYKMFKEKDCRTEAPLFHAKVTEATVHAFWKAHAFDLGLRPDQGNCDLCFMKGKRKLIQLIQAEPDSAEWWIKQEDFISDFRPFYRNSTFRKGVSYRELARAAEALDQQSELFELPQADPADEGFSCFCGD